MKKVQADCKIRKEQIRLNELQIQAQPPTKIDTIPLSIKTGDACKKDNLNNPEYRWYHPDKMAQIMPYYAERKRLNIKKLDYEELRRKNDERIKEQTSRNLDWDNLKWLIDTIPDDLDRTQKKKGFQPKDRLHFEKRDKGVCYICGSTYHYGSCNVYAYSQTNYKLSHLHHILPNGEITDDNIVTLCTHCHQVVHQIMYISGKWRYGRPL
jgi:hypothetical protein